MYLGCALIFVHQEQNVRALLVFPRFLLSSMFDVCAHTFDVLSFPSVLCVRFVRAYLFCTFVSFCHPGTVCAFHVPDGHVLLAFYVPDEHILLVPLFSFHPQENRSPSTLKSTQVVGCLQSSPFLSPFLPHKLSAQAICIRDALPAGSDMCALVTLQSALIAFSSFLS